MKFLLFSILIHSILLINLDFDFRYNENQEIKSLKVGYVEEKKKKAEKLQNNKNNKIIKQKKEIETKKKQNKVQKLNKKVEKEKKKNIKEKPKKQKDDKKYFDDLLKDLSKKELTNTDKKTNIEKVESTIDKLANTKSEIDKISQPKKGELKLIENILLKQIDSKWTRPPGIKASDEISIKVVISLDIQGEVINLSVSKATLRALEQNTTLQPYLDSAIRAIKKSSPFEGLKKDRYNIWKEVIINFKPRETR